MYLGSAGRWVNCCLDPLSQEVITYVLIFGNLIALTNIHLKYLPFIPFIYPLCLLIIPFSHLSYILFIIPCTSLSLGIDNLAIFTVLFANVSEIETVVVVVVFYLMLFFYIALTIAILVTCPTVGHWFGNNVRYLVPFVLIGFGVYILYGSVIWQPNLE